MLLETALANFSDEREWRASIACSSPGETPWCSPGASSKRSIFNERRQNVLRLQDSCEDDVEELHWQEDPGHRKATRSRNQSGQYESAVPCQWEASPGKPMVQEWLSAISSNHHGPRRLPPASRTIIIPTWNSPVRNVQSRTSGIARRMECTFGGNGLRSPDVSTAFSQRTATDWSDIACEDADRDSVDSGDGECSSPVSTLDLPVSPVSPTCSPKRVPLITARHGGIVGTTGPANLLASTFITLSEMSEELPAVMEEDEEDLESVSGFHTIEFRTMESPCTLEDRRDWSLSGREVSSTSWSAPISRQSSLLRRGAGNRGRRRSDFDWPEDFDERPEEVVKEVDESLWAFSPVASTFVFSGNETADHRSLTLRPGVTGTSTPSGSSPASGSMSEHLSSRRSLGRPTSFKPNYGGKSFAEAGASYTEFPGQRISSRLRKFSVNDDDDYLSSSGHPVKRSHSCLPFFSLCSTQRPTPAISFSHRLSPNLSHRKH